ncbi:MAG: hypothetical protein K8S94_08405 [Planctomycetia bacterium]|nr:hypothetical protein [Planctomycetia bacterium]
MIQNTATRALTAALLLAVETTATAAPPAWGRIDDSRAANGRFTFKVTDWPADGRLAVPQGFSEIVDCTADAEGTRQDLVVEYNADATTIRILAPAGDRPAAVAVDTADETRQFDDGRIVLMARNATVNGTKAKLESHPANHRIGFWSDAAESVSWMQKLTRWGAYDVRLTYSTASPSGTEIEVELGDTKLAGRLESTGSWYRYATIPLGRVVIPAAGDLPVTVRCTKLVGGAVMNLKAITLTPACEGTPPVQAEDGTVTLHGRDATVRGTMLRWEPAEKKQTLGFWTRRADAAEWVFTVRSPSEFDVEVLQGCGTGQGGSEMAIEIDAARPTAAQIAFTVEDTGGFQAFRPRTVGRVTIAEAGDHTLRVQPQKIAKAAACDIRQIRLVPVTK